jgi:hypothetical protein
VELPVFHRAGETAGKRATPMTHRISRQGHRWDHYAQFRPLNRTEQTASRPTAGSELQQPEILFLWVDDFQFL